MGSEDCIHWDESSVTSIGANFHPDTHSSIVWDPRQQLYVWFTRPTDRYGDGDNLVRGATRRVARMSNRRLWVQWPLDTQTILIPDADDATESSDLVFEGSNFFYGMPTSYHAGIYFAWPYRRRVGPLSESTVGYALERMDLDSLRALSIGVARRLKRNGVLHWETAGGQLAMAIDGIELFQSESRCCADCLQRHKQREGQPVVEFYHRVVVASLVGFGFRFVVDLEGVQPGENEVGAGERLLRGMVGELGRHFFQIVTVDALYAVPSFVQLVRELGLELVAPLKANQPDLLEQAQRRLQGPPDTVREGPGSKPQPIWEEDRIWWDSGRRSVRVLWVVTEREVTERLGGHQQSRTIRREAFYLSTCPRPRTHAHSIVRLAAARWELETSTFAHLSSEYGLKHAQVHSGKPRAFVAQLRIRLLAAALYRSLSVAKSGVIVA